MTQFPAAFCLIFSFIRAFLLPKSFIASLLSEGWKKEMIWSRKKTLVEVGLWRLLLEVNLNWSPAGWGGGEPWAGGVPYKQASSRRCFSERCASDFGGDKWLPVALCSSSSDSVVTVMVGPRGALLWGGACLSCLAKECLQWYVCSHLCMQVSVFMCFVIFLLLPLLFFLFCVFRVIFCCRF